MTEKDLYRQARKRDAHWYLLALLIFISGVFISIFFVSIEGFIASMAMLGVWGSGIYKMDKCKSKFLEEVEPVVKRLMAHGFTEHDAMVKVGIDKFYYKPFWAIR